MNVPPFVLCYFGGVPSYKYSLVPSYSSNKANFYVTYAAQVSLIITPSCYLSNTGKPNDCLLMLPQQPLVTSSFQISSMISHSCYLSNTGRLYDC